MNLQIIASNILSSKSASNKKQSKAIWMTFWIFNTIARLFQAIRGFGKHYQIVLKLYGHISNSSIFDLTNNELIPMSFDAVFGLSSKPYNRPFMIFQQPVNRNDKIRIDWFKCYVDKAQDVRIYCLYYHVILFVYKYMWNPSGIFTPNTSV